MENTCCSCLATLTVYEDDEHTIVRTKGEAECCCGDVDEDGNYEDAYCRECCLHERNLGWPIFN